MVITEHGVPPKPSQPNIHVYRPVMSESIYKSSSECNSTCVQCLIHRHSMTGLLVFVGSSPVTLSDRYQGYIVSIIYAAELSRTATDEDQSLSYVLHCIECNVPSDGSC